MVTRWEVTKAVRASELPAPARLVMLVLADVAEVGTAEIPERFTPSLTVLADETGLGRSTVATHLRALERAGWIVRTRPATGDALARFERTRYQLCIPPSAVAGLVQEMDHPGDGPPSPGAAQPSPATGPPSAAAGHRNRSTPDLVRSSSDQRRAPRVVGDETAGQRVNRLAKVYTDRVRLSNFNAVAGVVRKAVNAGVDDEKITAGLSQLAEDGRSVTTDSLRYAIYGVPPSRFATNGHKPSTTDQRVSAALDLAAMFDGAQDRKEIGQ